MILKKVIKRLVPSLLLKRTYLAYNIIKIRTVDKIFFPERKISKDAFLLYQTLYPFRENDVKIDDLKDKEVYSYMNQWYNWTQEEFILKRDNCLIEPDIGWALESKRKLNYYSLGISRTLFLPKPSLIKLLAPKTIIKIDKLISLRDTGEENYFHFYNDVLAKLFFLKRQGIDITSFTILISEKLWKKSCFQFFYSESKLLKSLNWHVQKKEYIDAKSALFCKPLTHRKELFDDLLSEIELPEANGEKKVYLKRSKQRTRYIENAEEIELLFKSVGFEIVDADKMSPKEQITLFSQTKYLVAIHGAGITNVIYRKNASLSILELFPPPAEGYLPFHYIMISKMYDFKYQAMIGESARTKFSSGFYINSKKLKLEVEELLKN